MAKYCNPDVLDLGLNEILTQANRLSVLESQPANYAEAFQLKAQGGFSLGTCAIAAGDLLLRNGLQAGERRITVQGANLVIQLARDGMANHLALLDTTTSRLLYVTDITTPQAVLTGNELKSTDWDILLGQPI